jgi:hypothetical protein
MSEAQSRRKHPATVEDIREMAEVAVVDLGRGEVLPLLFDLSAHPVSVVGGDHDRNAHRYNFMVSPKSRRRSSFDGNEVVRLERRFGPARAREPAPPFPVSRRCSA